MRGGTLLAFGAAGMLLGALERPLKGTEPTYHQDIAPILAKKCAPCHKPGGLAPFSLLTYDDAKKRASVIRYQTIIRAMPPCNVTSELGEICKTPPTTDEEVIAIQNWVRAGSPEGPAPETGGAIRIDSAWPLGKPDMILRPEAAISASAEGAPYWRAIPLATRLPKGAKLRAFDVRPNTPNLVRYATLAIDSSDELPKTGRLTSGTLNSKPGDLIGHWAPGYFPWQLPAGTSKLLPAGRRLIVQVHCRPTGKVEDGGFEVALYFDKAPTAELRTLELGVKEFSVEAGESKTLSSERRLESASRLLGVLPQARFFASHVKVEAVLPSGDAKTVFETLRWDPYWVGNYWFKEPAALPAGTILRAKATYNNDERCPANEGKVLKRIKSGPTIDHELFRVYIQLAPIE